MDLLLSLFGSVVNCIFLVLAPPIRWVCQEVLMAVMEPQTQTMRVGQSFALCSFSLVPNPQPSVKLPLCVLCGLFSDVLPVHLAP